MGFARHGGVLKTQLFEVVIRESVIRNSFRNKKNGRFFADTGWKTKPPELSSETAFKQKKNKTQNGDENNDFQQRNGMQWFQFWIILENHTMGVIVFYKNYIYIM